jgi:hypothetical protein
MKKVLLAIGGVMLFFVASGQTQDTVIINLAKTSKIIFTVEDPEDLEILKHYDFQQLFEDILRRVEAKKNPTDSTTATTEESSDATSDNEETAETGDDPESESTTDGDDENEDGDYGHYENGDDDDDDENDYGDNHHGRWHRTWQAFNFDLGTNNYLGDNKFPSDNEAFAVRPWGSWYVGLASVQRSRIAKKFFLEWGLGMSWYSFKFQNDNILITPGDNGTTFAFDQRDLDFKKSKLSVSYVQASLIPVLDFGDHGRKARFWDGYNDNAFRIGFGPYVGYRISSRSKLVYGDGDDRETEKNRDGFFLNNFRYGARLQLGFRSTDLFFNYDLNELFQEDKGPKLNAFSFGVIF